MPANGSFVLGNWPQVFGQTRYGVPGISTTMLLPRVFNENSSAMAMGLPVENSSSSFVFADLASHQEIKMPATNDGSD